MQAYRLAPRLFLSFFTNLSTKCEGANPFSIFATSHFVYKLLTKSKNNGPNSGILQNFFRFLDMKFLTSDSHSASKFRSTAKFYNLGVSYFDSMTKIKLKIYKRFDHE